MSLVGLRNQFEIQRSVQVAELAVELSVTLTTDEARSGHRSDRIRRAGMSRGSCWIAAASGAGAGARSSAAVAANWTESSRSRAICAIADSLERAVAGCGVVFHVAADYRLWARDPEEMYRSNVEGTRNLLEAARRAGRGTGACTPARWAASGCRRTESAIEDERR